MTVTCSLNTPYDVRMDAGANGGGVVTARKLINGAELVPYSISRDASRTQNWGVTDGTDTVAATGNGLPQAHTVYGRIAGSANVAAGAFADTVNVTVDY